MDYQYIDNIMKINTIYNCIVLLYLHAFCLLLCFQIEDIFLVELNMGLGMFYNSSYWDLFLRMLFLSPFIGYYFFKNQEDTESNDFDRPFGIILTMILLLVVLIQLVSCGKDIISFEVPLLPGMLCCGVNFLSIGLYFFWIYSQKKFVTTKKIKLFRICNIGLILLSLLYSCTVANYYTPYKLLELHHNDKMLIQVIDRIQNKDKVFNNINEFINELNNKKEINKVKKLVESKRLIYQKIDENKYKLSWKTHLTKQEFINITRWNSKWHGSVAPSLYEKDNKIVTVKKQKPGENDIPDEIPEEVKNVIQAVDQLNNKTQDSNIKKEKVNTTQINNEKENPNNNIKEKTILETKKTGKTSDNKANNNTIEDEKSLESEKKAEKQNEANNKENNENINENDKKNTSDTQNSGVK